MNPTPGSTIREIVTADFRTAAVFRKLHIDFCCSAERTLADACRDQGVPVEAVLAELVEAAHVPDDGPAVGTSDLDALVSHILDHHHTYVREALPLIQAHTERVARVKGDRHPEMIEVDRVFTTAAAALVAHMDQEEQVVFPYIVALERARRSGLPAPAAQFASVEEAIRAMERDHRDAADAMERIRELTNAFTYPEDACTTFRVCVQELAALERDLHTHMHLENNLLFPAALELDRAVI